MSGRPEDRLLAWYRRAWRERYGDELVALMEDMGPLSRRCCRRSGALLRRVARRRGADLPFRVVPRRARSGPEDLDPATHRRSVLGEGGVVQVGQHGPKASGHLGGVRAVVPDLPDREVDEIGEGIPGKGSRDNYADPTSCG